MFLAAIFLWRKANSRQFIAGRIGRSFYGAKRIAGNSLPAASGDLSMAQSE
jgi:hypothetical protein